MEKVMGNAEAKHRNDFSSCASHASDSFDKVKEGVGELVNEAQEASKIGAKVAKETINRSSKATLEKAEEQLDSISHYIKEKPLQGMALAIGAGFLLGSLVKR